MGYRTYLAIVDKKIVNKLRKCKTKEDLLNLYKSNGWDYSEWRENETDTEMSYHFPVYKIPNIMEFEFGKTSYSSVRKCSKPILNNVLEKEVWDEYDARFGKDDMILAAIEEYKKKIISYFDGLINNHYLDYADNYRPIVEGDTEEETKKLHYEYLIKEIKSKLYEWQNGFGDPICLNRKTHAVNTSWLYEYSIFNLATMYHLYNPKKHYVMYFGW